MKQDDFLMFVPGPAEIHEEIREVGSRRLPYMRTPSFSELHKRVVAGLQNLLGTDGDVLLLTASGTGAMEATIPNFKRPARNVHDSLRFGFLFETIIRIGAKIDVAMANTGLMDIIVSNSLPCH